MILVTGGAGYIGSHTIKEMCHKGIECLVLDDLSRGHRAAVPHDMELIVGNIGDEKLLHSIFSRYYIEAIIHFAGSSLVSESMTDPGTYFRNNVSNTTILLDIAAKHNVKYFIFSSSAAVYGEPRNTPITESDPTLPINVYGQTKLMIEQMLPWFERTFGMRYVSLRYFNAAGADPEGDIGEDHEPETHLVPTIIKSVMEGMPLNIYGTNYDTFDGTCVRDFVHVSDLAKAHIQAYEYLKSGGDSEIINLGTGQGYSVYQILKEVERVIGRKVITCVTAGRDGDPPVLVASTEKAYKLLDWKPCFTLPDIISTAYAWHSKHPQGYESF